MNLFRGALQSEQNRLLILTIILIGTYASSYAYLAHSAVHNPQSAPYPIVKGDSQSYALMADNILAHGVFSYSPDLSPERQWPPGYALFLAGVKAISGGFVLAVVIQTMLALVASILVYVMAQRFVQPALALVPALLYMLDPSVIIGNTTIITDGIFSSLIVMCVYLMFFFELRSRGREIIRWAFVGVLMGVAVLIRPIGEFLIPILPIMYLFRPGGIFAVNTMKQWKTMILPLCVYIVAVLLVVTPWVIRNDRDFGAIEIAHVGASNLLEYNVRDFLAWRLMNANGEHISAIAAVRIAWADPAYAQVDKMIAAGLAQLTPPGGDQTNQQGRLAEDLILQHPFSYAYFHVINTIPFFADSSVAAYEQMVMQERDNSSYLVPPSTVLAQIRTSGTIRDRLARLGTIMPILLEVAFWFIVCLGALSALIIRRGELFYMLLFTGLVAYFALLTGPVSLARYRIPAEPYLFILAITGVSAFTDMLIRRTKRTRPPR